MELRACIKAFEYICESAKRLKINRAIIYTDSDYVHSNQARCEFWKKDKWRNKSGRPVENGDLWKQFILIKYRSPVRTEIQWIKGKSTAVVKAVDKAAKQAAKNPNKIDDSGYRSGRVARTKVVEKGGPSLFPAEGQMCIIRIYKREYRGAGGDQKVTFDLYSNGEFVSKYCAYLMEKSKIEIHRHQFYQVKFNTGPKYPLIVKARLLKPNSKLLK
jgi:ribonuclease HI